MMINDEFARPREMFSQQGFGNDLWENQLGTLTRVRLHHVLRDVA
jgi:hypothetical protein